LVVWIKQVGNDVVATATGSFNTSALGSQINNPNGPLILSGSGVLRVGTGAHWHYQVVWDNSTGFGTSAALLNATSGTGDIAGFDVRPTASISRIFVPVNYTSGAALLNSSATWANTTLSSLGLTVGTVKDYQYRVAGSNTVAGSVRLSVIPEPTSFGLWVLGLATSGIALRWRRS
jgi:hypothetical protein